jgi:hypothetical protein
MRKLLVSLAISLVFLPGCSGQSNLQQALDTDQAAQPFATVENASEADPVLQDDLATFPDEELSPGFEMFGIHVSDHANEQQLAFFEGSGASWSRFDRFHWDLIEPIPQTPPVYDWSSVDEAGLLIAANRGFNLVGIVLFTPPYAQKYPGSICGPIAEDHLDRFGVFFHALIQRYSQAPYHVKVWEIGNEPDVDYAFANRVGFGCWGDPNDPYFGGGYYAQMLKVVYPQIKAADPEAQVLLGGLLLDCDPRNPPETSVGSGVLKDCSPARFLDGILTNDGGPYFDGISFHAYDYYSFREGKYSNSNWHSTSDLNGVVSLPKVGYLQERLNAYGITDKYLLNTESGLICGSTGKEEGCLTDEFARTKAAYIVHTNTAAFSLGLRANIWYSLMGWRGSELVNSSYQSLPAYDAFNVNFHFMKDAIYRRQIMDYPNLFIYEFEKPQGVLWVMWSKMGDVETVQLPFQPSAVYDLYGNSLGLSPEMIVNYAPVYIEF